MQRSRGKTQHGASRGLSRVGSGGERGTRDSEAHEEERLPLFMKREPPKGFKDTIIRMEL